jgi:putative tryptophan/tyrosine transport system substrate-binding protein
MRRRAFIGGIGAIAFVGPTAVRAQQPPLPMVGFLYGGPREANLPLAAAFTKGLEETGFFDSRNVHVEYRWSDNSAERVPEQLAELVGGRPAVVVAAPTAVALAVKRLTSTVPIVFIATDNPVRLGLVASLNKPGGNMTGVNFMLNELGTKRLELLRDFIPTVSRIGLLFNPASQPGTLSLDDIQAASRSLGYQFLVKPVTNERDVQSSFASLVEWKADAAMVIPDGLVFSLRKQLAAQASQVAIPTIYPLRGFVEAGGLVSYGSSETETFKQMGNYAGRILKGEKPADLPVVQSAKFELVVNLRTAKSIGLKIPEAFLLRADEVIE